MDDWDTPDSWDADTSMAFARLGSIADTLDWIKNHAPEQVGPLVYDWDGFAQQLHAVLTGPKARAVIDRAAQRAAVMANSMARSNTEAEEEPLYGHRTYSNGEEAPGAAVFTENIESVLDDHFNSTLLKVLAAIGPTKGT